MYIVSFYSYLNYDEFNDFVIDLDDVWVWLGYGQKIKAKYLLEKHFKANIDYKILLCQMAQQNKKGSGGHNKETIMLNVNTFKLLCLKADTEKAKKIHKYYVGLENILHQTLQEESAEFKNQIAQLELDKNKLIKNKLLEKHNLLLREFGYIGSLVYIMKVKTFEDSTYVIKIGESRKGLDERFSEHKSKYDECVVMDCFLVKRSKDFESFIHSHEFVKPSRITNLKNHETEKELFLVGKELAYKTLLDLIKTNIKQFDEHNQLLEIEKLKLEESIIQTQTENIKALGDLGLNNLYFITELLNSNKILLGEIENLKKSNVEIIGKLNSLQTKNTTCFNEPLKTLGPKLQQINSDTLKLIKVFDSVDECIRQNPTLKRSTISKASKENTVYHGFRWCLVDREFDSNILYNIQPTKLTQTQNTGYIAKLNNYKTQILNVYLDRKVASLSNGHQSHSALDNPVKNFSLSNGCYYTLYDNCSQELKKQFIILNKGEPILYKNGIGQYDSKNNLIKEFTSKYDCVRNFGIGDKSLSKSLEKNIPYKEYYFKFLPEKTKCFN